MHPSWNTTLLGPVLTRIVTSLASKTCYFMIISDPNYYYHARKDPRWQVSMDEVMNSLQKNTTRELVSIPPGRKLVQWKWVFWNKVDADGST